MNPRTHDFGAYCVTNLALTPQVVNSSTDGVETNGFAIDRNSLNRTVYRSAKVSIPHNFTFNATDATVTVTANVQDSPTSTAWTDYPDKDGSTAASVITVTGTTVSTGSVQNELEFDVDLGAADRYVRVQVTVDMSQTTSSTTTNDTTDVAGVWVFGGPPVLPA